MKISVIIRTISPFVGVLLFLSTPPPTRAIDTPREILIEVDRPVDLVQETADTRTGLPDLDATLSQFPSTITTYAMHTPNGRHPHFKRYLLIRLPIDCENRVPAVIHQLAALSSVHWAQPNRLFRTHFLPNDPLYNEQWGLQRIHAAEAWDVTFGSSSAPIAIIDTGCEMDHPDLVPSIWHNEAEMEGLPGIDDDSNGFIDDSLGWDFVDAPTFPTGGDYLDRDNDPSDEMGHGTAVAGVAGAAIHNSTGIAGAAPSCPLMVLRAGNMSGFLQEDDVASALLYALDNGARIANMSFGDVQVSPMLEDAINYAANQGLVIVAAAGNSGTSDPIYPAAFSPTLSVGACNENDERTTFSSYGISLDLLAPGINITSTVPGQDYGMFLGGSGTSYAAPFASAVAGLVISLHPNWDQTEVRSVLTSSTDDIGPAGWDPETGQGILRADKAIQVSEALVADITFPAMEQGFAQTEILNVIGTAAGIYLEGYKVYSGAGVNPGQWNLVKESEGFQVIDDQLATWLNQEPVDTAYTLRLEVTDMFGNETDDRVVVYFDPSPPVISNIVIVPILDADRPSYLLSFTTDDMTTGKVWLLGVGQSNWISQSLEYASTEHTILLGKNLPPKDYAYTIAVENAAGLTDSTSSLGIIDLTLESMNTNNFVELPVPGIPPCYFLEDVTDLDNDTFLEIWVDTLDASGAKSNLRVYEANSGWTFTDLGLDFGLEIPKSIGDSDADSLSELLTLYGGRSKIFEATEANGFPQPSNTVWSDSSDVWGAKLLDLLPGIGTGEVLLVSGGVYQIYQNPGTGQLTFLQSLPNPINPTPVSVAPYCRVNDYDSDGLPELLFGDYQGSVYTYERQIDGTFISNWSLSLPQLDTGQFLTDGDFDGDGQPEFAVLAHTETEITGEHQADTRYWVLYIFQTVGDNQYNPVDTLFFFGAESPSDFASGISAGDVFDDAQDEILLCVYPDFYVVDWDPIAEEFGVIWYYPQCESNEALIGDFNRNGHNDILFSTGTTVRLFEEVGTWSAGPPPPLNFSAVPEDDRVNLTWSPVFTAEAYNLYKSEYPVQDSLSFLIEITDPQDTTFTDFAVVKDVTYYYAISTFDQGGYQSPDGPKSVMISATPNDPPYVVGDTALFAEPNYVTVQFNEAMGPSFLDLNNYWIVSNLVHPNSVVEDAGGTRAVLTFEPQIFIVEEDTSFRLVLHELFDLQGSRLVGISDTVRFAVQQVEHRAPYLMAAIPNTTLSELTLVFSEDMDSSDLIIETNYTITADPISGLPSPDNIGILQATADTLLQNTVQLSLNPETPIGALGKVYRVKASNVSSIGGTPIDTTRNIATLSFSQTNLRRTFVYPNPYRGGTRIDGEECMVFSNLTQDVEIRILTVEGLLIKTLKATGNVSGGLRWYLDNERGEKVGSGVYIYFASGGGDTFWGKLAVVR